MYAEVSGRLESPPSNDLESPILKPVSPAGYTAILRGKTGSGIALVKIYNLRLNGCGAQSFAGHEFTLSPSLS